MASFCIQENVNIRTKLFPMVESNPGNIKGKEFFQELLREFWHSHTFKRNVIAVRAKPELILIISDNVKTYFQQRGIDYVLPTDWAVLERLSK